MLNKKGGRSSVHGANPFQTERPTQCEQVFRKHFENAIKNNKNQQQQPTNLKNIQENSKWLRARAINLGYYYYYHYYHYY